MKKALFLPKQLLYFLIPFTLLLSLVFLIRSPLFDESDILTLAISIDLLLIVPLVYAFLIRKTNIPKTTIVPVVIVGLALGFIFLPKENQTYLELFKIWILPLVELSVVVLIFLKKRKAIRKIRSEKEVTPDFYDALRNVISEFLPQKFVSLMATEVAVIYYGFINWKKRPLQNNEFSYHLKSGSSGLLIGLIMVIAAETVTLHHILSSWSNTIAWILTILSVYTALQVFGFAKSLSQRPIVVSEIEIRLRYGILNEVSLPLSEIEKIELSSADLEEDKLTKTLSPLGTLESHNVILQLKNEHQLQSLYGIMKRFKTIAFHVDEPQQLIDSIHLKITQ